MGWKIGKSWDPDRPSRGLAREIVRELAINVTMSVVLDDGGMKAERGEVEGSRRLAGGRSGRVRIGKYEDCTEYFRAMGYRRTRDRRDYGIY